MIFEKSLNNVFTVMQPVLNQTGIEIVNNLKGTLVLIVQKSLCNGGNILPHNLPKLIFY